MKNKRMRLGALVKGNVASTVFIIIAVVCFFLSGMSFSYVLEQVFVRLAQNSFLVLALIIPIVAGMGLNFSITVGAMAAQIAIFLVTNWAYHYGDTFTGMSGFTIALILMIPMALLFGWLAGKLLNKTKGQEMIAGMILGYFATGIYMFIFLIVAGGVIPIENPYLVITGGVGIKNTFDISFSGALDKLFQIKLRYAVPYICSSIALYYSSKSAIHSLIKDAKRATLIKWVMVVVGVLLMSIAAYGAEKDMLVADVCKYAGMLVVAASVICMITAIAKEKAWKQYRRELITVAAALLLVIGICVLSAVQKSTGNAVLKVKVPISTYFVISLLCLFNVFILKTKNGQNLRTVGQSMEIATASGIDVNKTRIYATVLSTLFAGIGQLIYLQSLGAMQTYAAQNNVALYSVAALLVGGASVTKATNKQAIFGIVIFHTILIVLPDTIKILLNDAQNSEYIRMFIIYSVICFSLITYAVSEKSKGKLGSELVFDEGDGIGDESVPRIRRNHYDSM